MLSSKYKTEKDKEVEWGGGRRARQLRERARLGGGLGNEAEIDLVRGSTRAGKSLAGCRRA